MLKTKSMPFAEKTIHDYGHAAVHAKTTSCSPQAAEHEKLNNNSCSFQTKFDAEKLGMRNAVEEETAAVFLVMHFCSALEAEQVNKIYERQLQEDRSNGNQCMYLAVVPASGQARPSTNPVMEFIMEKGLQASVPHRCQLAINAE